MFSLDIKHMLIIVACERTIAYLETLPHECYFSQIRVLIVCIKCCHLLCIYHLTLLPTCFLLCPRYYLEISFETYNVLATVCATAKKKRGGGRGGALEPCSLLYWFICYCFDLIKQPATLVHFFWALR